MGVGGLLEESMDPEACLEAAQNAKETRKKIYGYENLGVAKVNDYLNIRKDPSENGELVGKLPKNGGADVLSEENGWYKIKSGKVTGYVRADYMVTGEEARNLADKEATNMAVCNSGGLRVREEGSLDAPVITLVAEGEELEVVDIQDDWVKIMLDDEAAYVSADYVDIAKKLEKAVSLTELKYGQGVSDIRDDLVNYAKQFLGNPYVWGGTRPDKGFDCSGLVFYAYNKILEAKLPRTANEMYHYRRATIVANNDLRRGDLLFFHIHSREIADHMGVYLGDGQFIESPRTGETIRISRLAEPFWQDHFLGARRILTEETIL